MAVSVKQNKKAGTSDYFNEIFGFPSHRSLVSERSTLSLYGGEREERQSSLIICIQLVDGLQYAIRGRFNCLILKLTDVR